MLPAGIMSDELDEAERLDVDTEEATKPDALEVVELVTVP